MTRKEERQALEIMRIVCLVSLLVAIGLAVASMTYPWMVYPAILAAFLSGKFHPFPINDEVFDD